MKYDYYKFKSPLYSITSDFVKVSEICENIIYNLLKRSNLDNLNDIDLYFYRGNSEVNGCGNYYSDAKTFYLYSNYKYFKNKLNIKNIHDSDIVYGIHNEIHIVNNRTKETGVVVYYELCIEGEHGVWYEFLDKERINELKLI